MYMLKKYLPPLLALLLLSPPLFSADNDDQYTPPAVSAEAAAALAKEPPLTQTDVDTYLRIWPKLALMQEDDTAVDSLLKDAGWSRYRATYVINKILFAQPLAQGADPLLVKALGLPPSLYPSDADVALVKKNLDAITRIQGEVLKTRDTELMKGE